MAGVVHVDVFAGDADMMALLLVAEGRMPPLPERAQDAGTRAKAGTLEFRGTVTVVDGRHGRDGASALARIEDGHGRVDVVASGEQAVRLREMAGRPAEALVRLNGEGGPHVVLGLRDPERAAARGARGKDDGAR